MVPGDPALPGTTLVWALVDVVLLAVLAHAEDLPMVELVAAATGAVVVSPSGGAGHTPWLGCRAAHRRPVRGVPGAGA